MKYLLAIIKFILKIPAFILMGLIWLYKYTLSPLLPHACRFTPTCSEYGMQSIKKFGFFKGMILLIKRMAKCHPWGGSGYDPIP